MDPLKRLLGDKVYQARNRVYLITDVLLVDSNKTLAYSKPKFIKYLMERIYYQHDHNY